MLSFTNLMIYLWAKGKVVHKYHPVNAEQTLITSITAQFTTECLLTNTCSVHCTANTFKAYNKEDQYIQILQYFDMI